MKRFNYKLLEVFFAVNIMFLTACKSDIEIEIEIENDPLTKSGEVVVNPGQGWVLYGDPANHSTSTIALGTTGYTRFKWFEVNPQEDVYDWSSIDKAISQWSAHGKQFAFGITTSVTPDEYDTNIPQWVFDKGMQYETASYSYAAGRDLYLPEWNDPVFLAALKKFLSALADKYDGHPNISYIDIRIYGLWGELHWDGVLNYQTRLNDIQLESLHQIYLDYFKKTPLVQNFNQPPLTLAFNQWAVDSGIGLRGDGIMGPEIWSSSTNGVMLTEAIGKFPVVWELWGTFKALNDGSYSNTNWDDERFLRIIKENKPNYIGLGKNGGDAIYMLSQKPELVREVANLMGFNFSIISVDDTGMSSGEAMEISVSIENSGVTVMLTDCVIKLLLLDDNDKVVFSFTTDWDAKSINGGTTEIFTANVVFADVAAGSYKLAIGLYRNGNDQKPTYNLDNKGRTKDGSYTIGTLKIKK